jgi:hypothetical protein
MKVSQRIRGLLISTALAAISLSVTDLPASAQTSASKPNILFIMGDDIGIMQPVSTIVA